MGSHVYVISEEEVHLCSSGTHRLCLFFACFVCVCFFAARVFHLLGMIHIYMYGKQWTEGKKQEIGGGSVRSRKASVWYLDESSAVYDIRTTVYVQGK